MANLGTTRRVDALFEAAGVPTDPTTLALTITAPDGTVAIPTPDHDGPGAYHYDLLLDQEGDWLIDWAGTGAVPAEQSMVITVDGASFEGPCSNWVEWGELGDYCTPADIPPGLQDGVLRAATRALWNRTCQQFGLCTITRARVVPVCGHQYRWRSTGGWWPSGGYGAWWGLLGGPGCGCGNYRFIDLGVAPVVSVDEVLIDGVALDPGSYRVDDWRRLVRTDGNPWPPSSIAPDSGGTPTVEVSWTYGSRVPPDGRMAAALLVCKMSHDVAEQCGTDPSNMVTKAAEGVVIQINPPDGDTGIALVERWLSNFHCGGGGIFDPGARKATMRVST